jgi:glycosyltransferase involved in cell wall biosynthesis
LREAIFFLLKNPNLRLEMGKQARERAVREFSLETMAVKVLDLYETLYSA